MSFDEASEMYKISEKRMRNVPRSFVRSLYARIDWRHRLIAVLGPRGVGKTTMLLQRMYAQSKSNKDGCLYVSMDNLWLQTHDLRELVTYHVEHGGTHLFLDEVHYFENWQTLIKNLNDDFPELSIVYTGSSLLKIDRAKGDLSRRQVVYHLAGLSFREYLVFEGLLDYPAVSLPKLLSNHVEMASEVASKIKVFAAFDRYLTRGYYPFYRETGGMYNEQILQVVGQVLDSDFPALEDVSVLTTRKVRKMLMILAATPPQTLNLAALSRELEMDRKQCYKLLLALERAKLLMLFSSESETLKNMSRPEKIYCDNSNLMHALAPHTDIGTLRECFFLNQLRANHVVTYPKQGDFLVDDKWLFEVGGKGKGFDQIADLPDSYLAVDDLEVGRRNRIPLYLFGFLY